MELNSVKIRNFMPIGSADIKLSGRGLVAIQGVNLDSSGASSNGSGKSAIVESILWCLYGITSRGVKGDEVVKAKCNNTMVELLINTEDAAYTITRYRKHKTHKNRLEVLRHDDDGSVLDISKGTDRETQNVVEAIIGCSRETFTSAVIAGQEAMPDIPSMTDKALKGLIEEAAGADDLAKGYEIAKLRHRDAVAAENVIVAAIKEQTVALDAIESTIMDLKTSRDAWKDAQKRRVEERKDQQTMIAERLTKIPELYELADRLETAKSERDSYKAKVEAVTDDLEKHAKFSAIKVRLASDVERKELELARLESKMEAAKDELKELDAQVGKACGECGRNHTADTLRVKRIAILKKLETVNASIKVAETELGTLREKLSKATDAHRRSQAVVDRISDTVKQHSESETAVARVEKEIKDRKDFVDLIGKIDDQIKALEKEKPPQDDTIKKLLERRMAAQKIKGAKETELSAAQKLTGIISEALEVFGPKGLRANMLDMITPYLNKSTTSYLDTLTDGKIRAVWNTLSLTKAGELRERFAIDVTNLDGTSGFNSLSGGEKRKVRLACALALQDLVAQRATKRPIEIWIGDEIDDALDEAGLERLMTILEGKARVRGTVMVISHNDISDWIRNTITVTKEKGEARVS